MTPKFTRTTIPEKETLGEKLSKKRAALGYDIKEAERSTRIRARHIEALESGDYTKLPPDVYVRGFLNNYAVFLKLDPKKVIQLYKKERGLAENVKKAITKKEPVKKKAEFKLPKVVITPQRLAIGGAIGIALAILIYIGFEVSILAAPPNLVISNPTDNIKVEEDSLIVDGSTDAGADVLINEVPIGVDPDGKFKEKISLQDGVNLIKVTSKNKLGKQTTLSRTVLAKLKTLAATTQAPTGLDMKIDIGPNSNSIYIEVDGRALSDKYTVMLPGSSQTIHAGSKISISTGDGGSIRVTLNGKDLGTLGKTGEKVTKREFTKDSN